MVAAYIQVQRGEETDDLLFANFHGAADAVAGKRGRTEVGALLQVRDSPDEVGATGEDACRLWPLKGLAAAERDQVGAPCGVTS